MTKLLPDICRIQYGFAFDSAKFSNSKGTPLIRIRDVVRGYSETYTTEECGIEYTVNDGDILIGMDGEFNIAHWKGGKAYLNQRVCKLIPTSAVDSLYLYYFMPKALKAIEDKTPFVTVKHLSAKELNKVAIPVPPMEEQRKIAGRLKKVDTLIALRKEQLAALDQLVKSRFIELLQPYFDKGETQPLIGLVCEDRPITYGILKPGTNREGGYPVIRVKDFSRGLVSVEEVLHTTPEIYNKYLRSVLAEGDIIISIGGTIGRIAIVPKEFVGANITQHTARIALEDKRYLLYFRGLLESDIMQRWMKDRVLGVAQPSINLGDVKQMPIPIVDECVIKELNAFVEQTDKSKLAIQRSLDELETLKKALMQKYFG